MTFQTGVERRGGELVVVKRAESLPDCEALAAEAAILERLAHPGIVALVSFDSGSAASELVTAHAGSMTCADYAPKSEVQAARVGARVAVAVADLHSAGLCHGGLTPDHVIVGSVQVATLCSLGHAVAADDEAVEADVAAVKTIVTHLVERCPPTRGRQARRQRRALRVAITGTAGEPRTAAELAAAFAAVPGASGALAPAILGAPAAVHTTGERASSPVGAPPAGEPAAAPDARTWRDRVAPLPQSATSSSGRRPSPHAVVIVGGTISVAALVWAALVGGESGQGPHPVAEAPAQAATQPVGPGPAPTGMAATPTPPSAGLPVCFTTPRPVGCSDDVEVVGRFVRAGVAWFELGADDGDQVLIGDWNCDGRQVPLVLRPSTGQVFLFSDWADPGEALDASAVAWADPGRRGIVVERSSCHQLMTTNESGDREPVPLP